MSAPNPYQSSADQGSGNVGVNLAPHITGNPLSANVAAGPTSGHTWLIIVLALGALWLLAVGFKSIRLG